MASPILTLGRALMTLGNIFVSAGSIAADYNKTHVFNERWPPHARFHNGQTMTLSVLLSGMSMYLLYRSSFAFSSSAINPKDSVFLAAIIGSFYCAAGTSAIFYPGTAWKDPEFNTGEAQKFVFPGQVALMWVGYALEMRRLGNI
ncbi:hypothetical protein BAUCODRAFT_118198 [Baudoinia panamericana UAMH 10762]|uniref:MARVEL domain-containing protein n=1 Tax=Baudoinia panamericana (strain UAMH 10762) TaxID=717646 RepID=M2MU27_BAUPA|nr:uncharacterized protein BAUCODRAFT_118198 [Baudoinia panamericana UAMH 10762]EMD00427.1 hypothetical protein BAUCODRAFT_118198 [Baudoinia panamericana UAMH 10762]